MIAFDKLLLIGCILVVFALVLYFFYFNRLISFLLGLIFRVLYWNDGPSSVWLEIGSIHFSILTGSVLIRDLRYHSSNQTIRIVKGQIEWRYWIRKPASGEDIAPARAMDDSKQTRPPPSCRVNISLQGLEWFLYNRTAAYDAIVAQMGVNPPSRPVSRNTGHQSSHRSTFPVYSASMLAQSLRVPPFVQKAWLSVRQQLPTLDPKDLLPLGIQVIKGAIICGNPSTPNLLVTEFQRTEGMFGIVQSRSKHDLYKQLLHLSFQKPLMRFVENEDYGGTMGSTGESLEQPIRKYSKLDQLYVYLSCQSFGRLWRQLRLSKKFPAKQDRADRPAAASKSHGKHKSLDEDPPSGADFTTMEYAIERKILEAPVLELTYYVDVVGDVPSLPDATEHLLGDIGNGDIGPEWGIDLVVRGGVLRHGPWADRQRAELQKTFFPPTYRNAEETPRLKPGDKRVWTAMQVFIELRDDTMLYVPFREASKNWQWDGKADFPRPGKQREPASIHLTVGDRSSINYMMPMVASPSGYEAVVEVHLDTVAVTSSLNDIGLVSAESCRIRGELPSPLRWDARRTWNIGIFLRQPVLYLLRDHINMFTDLGKDWASGPPSDYHRFVPTVYHVDLELHHFELNLYVNDNNIIDKPLVKDENALLTVRGSHLKNVVDIPSDTFRPVSTLITIALDIPDVSINLSLPRWNTWALHAPTDGHSIVKARVLHMDASYRYYAEVREDHVEQFKLSFVIRDLAFKGLGWAIRHFMILQNNYFGSFTTFSTLFEHLENRKKGLPLGNPIAQQYRKGQSNMLQVELEVDLQGGLMVIPAGLPGYEKSDLGSINDPLPNPGIGSCLLLDIPELQVHFRLHDYFMELSLNISTITGFIESDYPEKMTYARIKRRPKEMLVIDGIDLTANRLFGPPPGTFTYVCIWEIAVGAVRAVLTAKDAAVLSSASNAFWLNYVDLPNAPAAEYMLPVYPDLTFVKFSLAALDLTWRVARASLLFSLPKGLTADTNDLGGQSHRKLTKLQIPSISVKFLLRSQVEQRHWLEVSGLETDAFLDIYSLPAHWREKADSQTAFIKEQDILTGRAERMFGGLELGQIAHFTHHKGVFLPQPALSTHRRYFNGGESTSMPADDPLSHLSESDLGEDTQLDTDRDAWLAKSRSENRRMDKADDANLSEGDESDTEGLSEGTSSDDDWPEIDLAERREISPALKRYSRLCRQYIAQNLDFPSKWEGSPFFLVKARQLPSIAVNAAASSSRPFNVKIEPRDDSSTTVYRFYSRKGLDITITPLVVLAITNLEADVQEYSTSPELFVDSMLAGYMSSFGDPKEPTGTTAFDIQLSSARVHILHEFKMVETSPLIANIAHLHCAVQDAHVIGKSSPSGMVLEGRVSQMNLGLDPISSGRPSESPQGRSLVGLTIASAMLNMVKSNPEVVFGHIALQIKHQSIEYIVALGLAVSETLLQVSSIQQRWHHRSSAMTSDIVYSILRASQDKPIIDPHSTIQPSYLVQSGKPQMLRNDVVFRFLCHLRNCLWEVGDVSAVPKSDFSALAPLLESCLSVLDPDVLNDSHLASLSPLFPTLENATTPGPSASQPTNSASLELHKFTIMLRDPSGSIASEFVLKGLVVDTRSRTSDFVEVVPGHTVSQVSLRNPLRQKHQIVSVSLATQEIFLIMSPRLMPFAQEVLRVKRQYSNELSSLSKQKPAKAERERTGRTEIASRSLELVANMHRIRLQAAAENLVFEFGVAGLQVISSLLFRPHSRPRSTSFSVMFKELYLRARSPTDVSVRTLQDILASITFTACKMNALMRFDLNTLSKIRVGFLIGGFHFNVPRSALRLYRFAQEWRSDFLPGIEATVQDLLSEVNRVPVKPLSPALSASTQRAPTLDLHGRIESFGVSLQVMHGTWLSWRLNDVVGYLHSSEEPKKTFGLELASQIFSITSKSNTHDATSNAAASRKLKVELPSLTVSGVFDGSRIHTMGLLDFVEFKVKPAHWDTLLAVQQKFGQDFNDLVVLIQETRASAPAKKPKREESSLKYSGYLKMRGVRIGLEGLSSTFYLECFDISGSIDNLSRQMWSLKLTDLALSLAPKAMIEPRDSGFNRQRRSAFVTIDLEVKGGEGKGENAHNNLEIAVTKIHAIVQPSSFGEVGDFVDHLQAELWDRREQRALDLAAFKEKAQSILKTFEVPTQDVQIKPQSSWLTSYVIDMTIHNIGVAFPLTHDRNFELPRTGSRDSSAVKAFLFSVKSIKFATRRGETGEAKMQGFSFQFVSRFRQSIAADFAGHTHQTQNRMIYPEMTAHLRSLTSASSRNVWIRANVSGFILDIDSSISDYIFSAIDVYEQGRDRVSQLSARIPRNAVSSPTELPVATGVPPTANVFASLTFLSGKVRAYNRAASELFRASPLSHHTQLPDQQMLGMGADVFNLPVVSVWTEYRTGELSTLAFKSTVHSSQNTLRPTTLLPFLTELVGNVEARIRQTTRTAAPTSAESAESADVPDLPVTRPASSLQISFSLRIDQSKLQFTCQPDVNVLAGLHWDSGGFVLHVSPAARKISLTGSIGGLTVGLKHGFLSEECAKLDMRNLTFSATFGRTEDGAPSVSFVLDTEILGAVRFSRLQDILCFKAVWLDRIPVFNNASAAAKTPVKSASQPAPFQTALLIRARKIILEVDLGQSISSITLDLKDAITRTKLTDEFSEVSVHVSDVAIAARGNVSGHASVSNCVFQTIRRMQTTPVVGRNRMLELRMTSDALILVLESDHQKLLHYRAEPLQVEVFDDWSNISTDGQSGNLQFSATVESPEIVAVVTVGTIPKLLSYANKFKTNLEAQREGASRESKTFHQSRNPRPENPLSAVAEAMISSARDRFNEADSALSYVVKQHMSLRLGSLRLVVFPRTMGDLEIAQFIGRDVCAQLDRLVELEATPAKRDLGLSFSFMTISRFTQLGHLSPPTILSDGREWLASLLKDAAEANIVGLPSMRIHMVSEELLDAQSSSKVLEYDFDSRFNRQERVQDFDDIYISLNVALYSWLTLLRKNLSREMEQVRATAEWRSTTDVLSVEGPPKGLKLPVKSATIDQVPEKPLEEAPTVVPVGEKNGLVYRPRKRHIERLTMRQLGEATPDVMHPFFMKKAGFNLEDALPHYTNEYATGPLEDIMEVLLKLYSRQLLAGRQ
ncbi:hypothetical protein FB45DRAFT_987066 [Roridomyces roridus]|uniref:Csf1 N-terminal domain-containing protein n=1 Tax=Roridomyces roridus TaxID=1738132 RepID=A0AAD7CFL2_9AGAR|nr:hypothetical protein FB45DRAFT_987066 [Roridomyces roridus]